MNIDFNQCAEYKEQINQELQVFLASQPKSCLNEAASYMLFPGGKRFRPLLAVCIGSDLGVPTAVILKACIALEFLHVASLVHDDLPALDNDNFRRGVPSCHVKFGEAAAILVGDYLIALAFKAISESQLSDTAKTNVVHSVSKAFSDLCLGQELDLSKDFNKDFRKINALKTAAVIEASLLLGVFSASVDHSLVTPVAALGRAVGLFYQVVDDLIDIFGSARQMGRPESSDKKNNKLTIVSNMNFERAIQLVEQQAEILDQYFLSLSMFAKKLGKSGEFPQLQTLIAEVKASANAIIQQSHNLQKNNQQKSNQSNAG